MTLAQLLALDPAALWDALPRERQMAIVVPLLLSEFAAVTAEDDGTDASPQDQETAAKIEHASFDEAMRAIEAGFPEILGDDYTALREVAGYMFDDSGRLPVKGLRGRRSLYGLGRGAWIRLGGRKVEVAGVKNHGTEDDPAWECWLQHHVDAERLRRHPEQALSFSSVLEPQARDGAPMDEGHDDARSAA